MICAPNYCSRVKLLHFNGKILRNLLVMDDTYIMCSKQYSIGSCIIIFGTLLEQIYPLAFYPFLVYVLICLCFLCTVMCMHSFHSAHIFLVCNSVICTNSFNILECSYCFKIIQPPGCTRQSLEDTVSAGYPLCYQMSVTAWGVAHLRFLGFVSVWQYNHEFKMALKSSYHQENLFMDIRMHTHAHTFFLMRSQCLE